MFNKLKMTGNGHRGFTVMELLAAMVIVGVCIAAFGQLYSMSLRQRQIDRTRQLATEQLQNVFEMLAPFDVEQWAAGQVDVSRQEEMIARTLPDGKLEITCEPHGEMPDLWLLKGTARWSVGENLPPRSVSLVRLIAAKSEPQPEPPVVSDDSEPVAEPVDDVDLVNNEEPAVDTEQIQEGGDAS